jgi:hypothetical protein
LIGVIDSGVNPTLSEFAGKVDPRSADLAGTRGMGDDAGHGTAVSDVILGARDGVGIHGVAFGSTLLALRTDDPGSCATLDANGNPGCSHGDPAIAAGVDLARTSGAKVVNISLGGTPASRVLVDAINRATAAGVIIVISAGNDGTADPDPLALIANNAVSRGLVIIAGGVDSTHALSVFKDSTGKVIGGSDAAGVGAAHYLAALGSGVRAIDNTGASFLFGGTSFSAPIITGAVALLAQAYPNLTPTQIVNLLFSTATNIGASATFGNGELNISNAFKAQGAASVAGTQIPLSLTSTNITLSSAMGDATQTGTAAGASTLILDGYGRAFSYDLGSGTRAAPVSTPLTYALNGHVQSRAAQTGKSAIALTINQGTSGIKINRLTLNGFEDDQAHAIAGSVLTQLSSNTSAILGFSKTGAELAAQLNASGGPAFLIAGRADSSNGFDQKAKSALGVRRDFGRIGLTLTAESGNAQIYDPQGLNTLRNGWNTYGYGAVSAGLDRRLGPLALSARLTNVVESQTILGARFGALNGHNGARSWMVDMDAVLSPARNWRLGFAWRQGWTRADEGGITTGGLLKSRAWSFDVERQHVFDRHDLFAFRIAQPMRVERGGLNVSLANAYDYTTRSTSYAPGFFNLTPVGRELDVESAYTHRFAQGTLSTNVYWRRDPGNFSNVPNDVGAAVRYAQGF